VLPENRASTIGLGSQWISPDERTTSPLVDYERGGVALLDASQGLMGYTWRCWVEEAHVYVQRNGMPPVLLFSDLGITEMSFTFDQNMRYCVAYVQRDVMKMRWYDSYVAQFVTTTFPLAKNPRVALDDKRSASLGTSDMILAYIRNNTLYYRQQRDRFTIERALRTNIDPSMKLRNIGMGRNLRFQFELV
jgi:hypothetical protein